MRPTLLVILGLAAVGQARAAPLTITGGSTCPSPSEFAAALARALPGRALRDRGDASAILVTVTDLGPGYQVSVAGATREVADERCDCAERARAAAVFTALVLEPPLVQPRCSARAVVAAGPGAPAAPPRRAGGGWRAPS